VFALNVDPEIRVHNVGTRLFDALCENFRQAGVDKVRTMLTRDDHLVLAFFRGLGMMAGPFIQLEKDLD
jgi:ribosomal protein S18 acetylase RimI-like enzyme